MICQSKYKYFSDNSVSRKQARGGVRYYVSNIEVKPLDKIGFGMVNGYNGSSVLVK